MAIADALEIRLWWQCHPQAKGRGQASYFGPTVSLADKPLLGFEYWALDFAPLLRHFEVQEASWQHTRAMTRGERAQALLWLREMGKR